LTRRSVSAAVCLIVMAIAVTRGTAQEVLDRIVARVEGDVLLLSEVRTLSRYQELVDGKSESDTQILDRLIDQWIVRSEATTARFPLPSPGDIDKGVERVQRSFPSLAEYDKRKAQVGLSDVEIRELVASQLYLGNYLDSRFRPSAQITPKEIEDFYQTGVVARAQARGQTPPTLEAAHDLIQEALVQRSIDEQANRWLSESRSRVHIEKFMDQEASK
jgi:hypothetical protein